MTHSYKAPHVPRDVIDVPGCEGLTITVYGLVKATTMQEEMEQAYFVALNNQPVVRAELLDREKSAIRTLLAEKFPQHARI